MQKNMNSLLAHCMFPPAHWDALRTPNPIEPVDKEFKRRSKAMEAVSADGLKALVAFTALRLELGRAVTRIDDRRLANFKLAASRKYDFERHVSS